MASNELCIKRRRQEKTIHISGIKKGILYVYLPRAYMKKKKWLVHNTRYYHLVFKKFSSLFNVDIITSTMIYWLFVLKQLRPIYTYLDDIIKASQVETQHTNNVRLVFWY